MKSLISTDTYTSSTRRFRFDKYPTVLLVEREHNGSTTRSIEPSPGCMKHVYLKELTLWRARYKNPCPLPFTTDVGSDRWADDDSVLWASALATSHSGQKGYIQVDDYPEFEAAVLPIDFRVYDDSVAQKLIEKYTPKPVIRTTNVDADLFLQGELGELPEQKERQP